MEADFGVGTLEPNLVVGRDGDGGGGRCHVQSMYCRSIKVVKGAVLRGLRALQLIRSSED